MLSLFDHLILVILGLDVHEIFHFKTYVIVVLHHFLLSFVVCALDHGIVILAANQFLRHTFASILHGNLKVVFRVFSWTTSLHDLRLRHM